MHEFVSNRHRSAIVYRFYEVMYDGDLRKIKDSLLIYFFVKYEDHF
jgi:hypothetical protein